MPRLPPQTVAEGRAFLAFLALVLRAEVENRMRAAGLLKKITVAEFLAEMGKIRAFRLPDGSLHIPGLEEREEPEIVPVLLDKEDVRVHGLARRTLPRPPRRIESHMLSRLRTL